MTRVPLLCRMPSLLLLALLLPGLAFGQYRLHFQFTTGGDDLRGGNVNGTGNNVDISVMGNHGPVAQLRNANGFATWGGGSVNEVTIDGVASIADLRDVTISETDRQKNDPFEQADHWDLGALRITAEIDGREKVLFEGSGAPLQRFTAGYVGYVFGLHNDGKCLVDSECDDHARCDGVESCAPSSAGADRHGCVQASPPCAAGMICNEAATNEADRCRAGRVDADNDGHFAMSSGGDDCDDNDSNRFPGNAEICDTAGHDEDCDSTTYGHRDADGDGHDDSNCMNVEWR